MIQQNDNYALIVGRFQPFHIGHLNYASEVLNICNNLIVAITNPDPSKTKEEIEDNHRHRDDANPFTYYERMLMVRESLSDLVPKPASLSIVPFPIHHADLWQYYIPDQVTVHLRVIDFWDEKKVRRFLELGYSVREHRYSSKLATGSEVRRMIFENGNWEMLVPAGTAKIIRENKLFMRRI